MQTSAALTRLLDDAPPDRISAGWIAAHLQNRSFGFVMLVLGLAGLAPGIASVSGFLLAVPALQMIAGRDALVLPDFLATRSASTPSFAKWVRRAIPVFAAIERVVPPRAPLQSVLLTRLIGVVDLLLALAIIAPVPFAYIPPTLAIILISFAQIEDSIVLLVLALIFAMASIFFVMVISWTALMFLLRVVGL